MKRIFLTALLALLVFAPSLRAADDFFPLGIWYEGGVGNARDNVLPEDPAAAAAIYERNFADIAAHGINVITIPNSPPPHHKIVLDTAQKHGLKVILELDLDGGEIGHMVRGGIPYDEKLLRDTLAKKLGPIKDHPALLRVQLLDEPPEPAFERYGKIAGITREYDPQSGPFCCLVWNVNAPEFLKHAKSDVIAFDFYPIGWNDKPGAEKPLRDFAEIAKRFVDVGEAAELLADSWSVLQCHEITNALRFPTPAELRNMTYVSLATGNRGIFWFLYQTERVGEKQIMSGLVDREFKSRPLWDEVAKLTKEIEPLTPTLANLRPERSARFEVTGGSAYALRDRTDRTLYLFVVSFDTKNETTAHVAMPLRNGVITPVGEDNPLDIRGIAGVIEWDVTLPPGGGKLFKVQ